MGVNICSWEKCKCLVRSAFTYMFQAPILKLRKKKKKIQKNPPKKANPKFLEISIKNVFCKHVQFIKEMRNPVHKILFLKWKKIP